MTEKKLEDIIPEALVIGGGIAGMQAALEIADKGFKTYLVEKTPSVGGRMSQLDKTFPTLDCAACTITPKMVEVGNHPNIELLTYSEIKSIEKIGDNFKAVINKKPRYVDAKKCTGCGSCAEACVLKNRIPNEFDENKGKRAAAYVPFPQAVPLKYTIDPERCLTITKGKCGKNPKCKEACKPEAIDFSQKEESLEVKVGAVIIATGYDLFDAKQKPELGYGKYENVITGLEFERLVSSSGPTKGEIIINGKKPKNIVFIQCVGSRDHSVGNEYCSRVCCMYTAKQAHLIKEKIPDAKVTICYIDIRAFGKGFEEFYERVQKEGVIYRRGLPSEIYKKGEKLVVKAEDTLANEIYEEEADLVVLATGIMPRKDSKDISSMLGLSHTPDKFYAEKDPQDIINTNIDGVYLAGCCQGPKDIPDAVAQASGAAALASKRISKGKRL